ncbi:T3SS (YopN, CesT) and YbjN peptide-binding chaperone 1 [Propionibacteriaceae bacterium G1746]|uniref:T3SS (YopN, CesT) and YbjN peptide-binding chaperone 1 n=1 Tax=Aestuariimicrobium sp. G57 TaxID=3418485 RepID=UPI003C153515
MESTDLDIDRSIATAWESFADRLAEVVSVIDDGGQLTIGTMSASDDPAPFIRFTHVHDDPDMILVEAASNASLGDGFQLTGEQLQMMERAGWQPPTSVGDNPTANFWRLVPQEHSEIAAVAATSTLWTVYGVQHPVFLAPDQLAEILRPQAPLVPEDAGASPVADFDDDDLVAVMPRDQSHLDELVTRQLTDLFGHPPLRDADGDITIRVGSSMVFVRTTPGADEVVLFSVMVHDVESRTRAVEVLNDLNVEAKYGRFALFRDRVFVTMSLLAHPFVPAHLVQGMKVISQVADEMDDLLAAKLRGRTTFEDGD